MKRFQQCQDYEKTYKELTAGDTLKGLHKSKVQKQIFKEHVSNWILYDQRRL